MKNNSSCKSMGLHRKRMDLRFTGPKEIDMVKIQRQPQSGPRSEYILEQTNLPDRLPMVVCISFLYEGQYIG